MNELSENNGRNLHRNYPLEPGAKNRSQNGSRQQRIGPISCRSSRGGQCAPLHNVTASVDRRDKWAVSLHSVLRRFIVRMPSSAPHNRPMRYSSSMMTGGFDRPGNRIEPRKINEKKSGKRTTRPPATPWMSIGWIGLRIVLGIRPTV